MDNHNRGFIKFYNSWFYTTHEWNFFYKIKQLCLTLGRQIIYLDITYLPNTHTKLFNKIFYCSVNVLLGFKNNLVRNK